MGKLSIVTLSRSVAGLWGAVAVGRGRRMKGRTMKISANIANSILMQWSHETTFAIIIFKISRLRLLAPLGDFCPPNHLVPSPVDDFSTRHRVAHLVATEQVARPATKRFHPSDWRPREACCRAWTWWCNDATAGLTKT